MEKVLEMPSLAIIIRKLCDGVQRCERAVIYHGRCMGFAPGASGSPSFAAIRRVAGLFAVHNVGGDGQNGQRVHVRRGRAGTSAQGIVEAGAPARRRWNRTRGRRHCRSSGNSPSVSKSADEAGLGIADAAHLSILDGGKGVCHAADMPAMPNAIKRRDIRYRAAPSGSSRRRICRAYSG